MRKRMKFSRRCRSKLVKTLSWSGDLLFLRFPMKDIFYGGYGVYSIIPVCIEKLFTLSVDNADKHGVINIVINCKAD